MTAGRSWRTNFRWTIAAPGLQLAAPRTVVSSSPDSSAFWYGPLANSASGICAAPASAAARLEGGVHREQEGGRIGVRVRKAEVAPDRAHRPHAQVADARAPSSPAPATRRARWLALDRTGGSRAAPIRSSPLRRSMPRSSSIAFRSITCGWSAKPNLNSRKSSVPPDVCHRVSAEAFEQLGRLLDRLRPVALEWRQHASSGHRLPTVRQHLAGSRRRRRRHPTSTPRSSNPRPSADTATCGYSERAAGPMCPIRNSRSASSP